MNVFDAHIAKPVRARDEVVRLEVEVGEARDRLEWFVDMHRSPRNGDVDDFIVEAAVEWFRLQDELRRWRRVAEFEAAV